jgi:hypothetical protein
LDLSLHDQMRIPAFSAKILQVNGQGYLPGVIHGEITKRSPFIGPRTNKALSHKVNCASRITQQFRLCVSSGRMGVLEPRLYMCSADHLKVPCSSSTRTALEYRESFTLQGHSQRRRLGHRKKGISYPTRAMNPKQGTINKPSDKSHQNPHRC